MVIDSRKIYFAFCQSSLRSLSHSEGYFPQFTFTLARVVTLPTLRLSLFFTKGAQGFVFVLLSCGFAVRREPQEEELKRNHDIWPDGDLDRDPFRAAKCSMLNHFNGRVVQT